MTLETEETSTGSYAAKLNLIYNERLNPYTEVPTNAYTVSIQGVSGMINIDDVTIKENFIGKKRNIVTLDLSWTGQAGMTFTVQDVTLNYNPPNHPSDRDNLRVEDYGGNRVRKLTDYTFTIAVEGSDAGTTPMVAGNEITAEVSDNEIKVTLPNNHTVMTVTFDTPADATRQAALPITASFATAPYFVGIDLDSVLPELATAVVCLPEVVGLTGDQFLFHLDDEDTEWTQLPAPASSSSGFVCGETDAVFTYVVGAAEDPITISDPYLREMIERALEKTSGAAVFPGEMATLTSLDASSVGIRDLTGLEFATSLTTLELYDNAISDLSPLENLTRLTLLDLGQNNIRDLSPLLGLTNLTTLGLSGNDITDLAPLVANTGLGNGDEVDVTGNLLSDTSINTHIPALQARGVRIQY